MQEHLGEPLIGRLNRDATAIEVRERPARRKPKKSPYPYRFYNHS